MNHTQPFLTVSSLFLLDGRIALITGV